MRAIAAWRSARNCSRFSLRTRATAKEETRSRSLDAYVIVGNDGDICVAELELARKVTLGVCDHVHGVPTHLLKPAGLGQRREAWSLDDHRRAAVEHGNADSRAVCTWGRPRSAQKGSAAETSVVPGPS
jgi:hypothetical protein